MKHYIHKSVSSPDRPVEVFLVGCGGTGSQVLTGLARMHISLLALGHKGLDVTVVDPDTVSAANVGRQLFSPADIGQYKAVVLATRLNQFFGLDWSCVPAYFNVDVDHIPDIIITAVDTVKARLIIPQWVGKWADGFCYWCDLGNTKTTGQVIIGTLGGEVKQPKAADAIGNLPCVTDLYDLKKVKEKEQGTSCSLAAALEHQDLMINQMVATCILQLLWQGFRRGYLSHHGAFIDLASMRVSPLPVDPKVWKRLKKSK